jgi:hypothetical protein
MLVQSQLLLIVEGTDGLQSTGDGTDELPVVYTVFLPRNKR